jgi:hypothetical protein
MLKALKEKGNDNGISVLTSIIYKSEFKNPAIEDIP